MCFIRNPKNGIVILICFVSVKWLDFSTSNVASPIIEEQKDVKEIRYTNPGDLFLHGLIDTKRGTCGNMSALHVAIGRRLDWPVSLASVGSHTVCRFDNGKVAHNLEATDTGRGGFAVANDQEYAKKFGISQLALERGGELKSMTAREMLGYFIALRARHYADIGELGKADIDYSLARSIIPNHRRTYMGGVQMAVGKGNWLFFACRFAKFPANHQ
jgi:hypothetical protein